MDAGKSSVVFEKIKGCLVELIQPSRIIVFGSHARGQASDDSDIDIAVIAGDGQPVDRDILVRCRVALRRALKDTDLAIDLILQSQEKFDAERRVNGSIQQTIYTEGIVIYDHGGRQYDETGRWVMDVGELRRVIEGLPDDMPVMMPCEVGVDLLGSARAVPVIKTLADWQATPVGNYRIVDQYLDEEPSGEAFQALVLDFSIVDDAIALAKDEVRNRAQLTTYSGQT